MRLRPFRLHRPTTVEQASELFDELGPDAVPYCGGTELLLVAKFGLTDFSDLVDVKSIDELAGIDAGQPPAGAGGELRIGASTTHRQIERSALVLERVPSLAAMERAVGNLRVRNVGTIGGNLAFGDPHSDPATYLLAAGGSVSVRRGGAPERRMSIEEFVRGPYQTALEQGELLVAVHVPVADTAAPDGGSGSALVHRKMSFHERPTITVTANITVGDGAVLEARLAVGSVGLKPRRVREAEHALLGLDALAPSPDQLASAAEAAALESDPVADSNGSIAYKRQLVRVLTARCVSAALPLAASPTAGA